MAEGTDARAARRAAASLVWAAVLGAAFALGAAGPSAALAYCRMSTRDVDCTLCEDDDPASGCFYLEWRRRCVSIAIDRAGARDFSDAGLRSVVQSSIDPWLAVTCAGASPGFDVRLLTEASECDVAEYNSEGGNVNAVVFISDWGSLPDHEPSAYALTTVWHNRRSGEIYDADIEVNEEHGTYAVCPERLGCDDGRIDLQNVLTHEVGHFFGLGHSREMASTMYDFSTPGEVGKRILRTDDISGFCETYPAGSLPEVCEHTPRGGLSMVCGGEEGCGCEVAGGPARAPWLFGALVLGLALLRRRWSQGLREAAPEAAPRRARPAR